MLHIRHAHIMTDAILNLTDNGTQQEAAGAAGELYTDLAEELLQVAGALFLCGYPYRISLAVLITHHTSH